MTGKSYSIKEMKTIVEYLTENKLYGEIKGRKMWMDLATSKLTNRTWQSLKETFLKRILPDVHNPYYRLTIEQINSFRAGYDVSKGNTNKLEIHTISDDSSSNGGNQSDKAQSINDYGIKEEIISGENIKCSKIPSRNRSSADTVIVETCYQTAEDIQKDLESPRPDHVENGEKKSLRDCITYSEPLTPMLQEVLDDFQSEPENEPEISDRENQLEIVNSDLTTNTTDNVEQDIAQNEKGNVSNVANGSPKKLDPPTVKDSVKKVSDEQSNNDPRHKVQKTVSEKEKEPETLESDVTQDKDKEKSGNVEKSTANIDSIKNKEIIEISSENTEPIQATGTLNNSNNTTDASLPNNPEALKKRTSNEKQDEISASSEIKNLKKLSRKRSNSEHIMKNTANKKSNLEIKKNKATSETESKKANNIIALNKSRNVKPKQKDMAVDNIPNNKKDAKSNDVTPNLANILDKPSTSIANDVDRLLDSDSESNANESAEIKNPCLQNVSLFEEQFNKKKYKSESSDVEQKMKSDDANTKVQEKSEDVVMLKSHSDSESEVPIPPKKHRAGVATNKDRERALANVFGFSSGAANSKRRRQLSRSRRTISHNNISHNHEGSDSSEWTSESDSDTYVSPPRGRKNRHTKKYLKPQSGRILSLEEEGGLFVMYGKKIYPLVKDGKLVKNYLTYLPESESDEENYWKLKYVEEKKKAEQLKKLLQEAKKSQTRKSDTSEQPNPLRNSTGNHDQGSSVTGKEVCLPDNNERDEKKVDTKVNTPESIKIRFTTKNDQEIHLEGNWPQIHNVLEHVVHIFHKEPQPVSVSKPKTIVEPPSSSGISTPVVITAVHEPTVDPEIHEKVNKIESEIFKEIEERDQQEQNLPNGQVDANITKRKPGRPRRSSQSSTPRSPVKRQKISDQQAIKQTENNVSNSKETNENSATNDNNKRQIRTPRKVLNESLNTSETKTIQTRRSKVKLDTSTEVNEDEDVRYMLPPRSKRQAKATDKNARDKPQKSSTEAPKVFSSPETACTNTMESTQGYQDSDPSPMKTNIRKKKFMNSSVLKSKAKNHIRRSSRNKSLPRIRFEHSNVSSIGVTTRQIERDNSTLNTEVYRSESYQLLMPQIKASVQQLELEQIDETSLISDEVDFVKHLNSISKNEAFSDQLNTDRCSRNSLMTSDIGSSSNVSLPLSPELSIVENLSISKDILNNIEDQPSLNEMQGNIIDVPTECSQYVMSHIDVSLPLMQQECGLESCNMLSINNEPKITVTESLLNKIETVNIKDQTDVTIALKLRDLLLESAKKITVQNERANAMEVDVKDEGLKKGKNKNRCSTPRKRKDMLKAKTIVKVQPVIEEEHMESCSQGGRKSCPPVLQVLTLEANPTKLNIDEASLAFEENVKSKGRKKKDIIKVKILRPKNKKSQNNIKKSVKEISKISICTDSGINETESVVFAPGDESVDLIHNHSETCLHANECVGDSVEFMDNTIKSIISLGDSMQSGDNLWESQCDFTDANISPDLFCNNAQDVRSFYKSKADDNDNTIETILHSPIGTESSLITEDLSQDLPQLEERPNKWYLLSEDETTNNNITNAPVAINCFGANLKQIFPITCAVPDLSTITEMSRETDSNSRKPTLESLKSEVFDS